MKKLAVLLIIIFVGAAIWLSRDKGEAKNNSGGSRPAATSPAPESSVAFGPNSSLSPEDQILLAKQKAREFLRVPDFTTIKGPRTEKVTVEVGTDKFSEPVDLSLSNDFKAHGLTGSVLVKVNEGFVDASTGVSAERNYVSDDTSCRLINADATETVVTDFGKSVSRISFKAQTFPHRVQVEKIFR